MSLKPRSSEERSPPGEPSLTYRRASGTHWRPSDASPLGVASAQLCDLDQVPAPLWAQGLHVAPEEGGRGSSIFPRSVTS